MKNTAKGRFLLRGAAYVVCAAVLAAAAPYASDLARHFILS
jgi:hypothetical protein